MKISSFSQLDTLQLIKDSVVNIDAEYDKWVEQKREAARKSYKSYKLMKERLVKVSSRRKGE